MLNRYPISVRPLLRRSLIDIQYLAVLHDINSLYVVLSSQIPTFTIIMIPRVL